MSDENILPFRRDPNSDGLTAAHNEAAATQPTMIPAPINAPRVSLSYTISAAGFPPPTIIPNVTVTAPQSIPANDPRLETFTKIIGGILYLKRYDALEKLLLDPIMDTLSTMPITNSKQSALSFLLNKDFYIHPGQTLSASGSTPNTRHAYLINELCSKLTDEPNETADKMQTHIRNVIRTLLTMDEINCTREERYRKEKKPFHYIATSGNLEFVELFIARRPNLIPEPHSEDGRDIVATLKSEYITRKSPAQKADAAARINDIVTMISEATTQRNLENGDFNRISPEQYIARLMGEVPVVIDPKSLPPAEAPKRISAPKGGRKPKKDNGLEPQ
jgi:hypothetical protein